MFKHFINVLHLLNGYKTNLMFVFNGGYKYVHEEVFIYFFAVNSVFLYIYLHGKY